MLRTACARSLLGMGVAIATMLACDDRASVGPGGKPNADQFFVSITPERDSVDVGKTTTLTARVVDSRGTTRTDQAISWSSLHPQIASVNAIGLVTGLVPGSALIVAGVGTHSDTAAIRVQAGAPALIIDPELAEIALGDSLRFRAILGAPLNADVRGNTVQWTSSDQSVAAVSSDGLATTLAPGDVQLTAVVNGVTATALARVIPNPPTSITVTPLNSGIYPGELTQLTAVVRDARGRERKAAVDWKSSDPAIATADREGVVSGVRRGSVIITASVDNGLKASATVNVFAVPAATVTVTTPSPSLSQGSRMQAVATARDAAGNVLAGKTVAWSSSNPAVAQVGADGTISGLVVGNTTINAIIDSKIGSLPLAVVSAAPASIAVVPASATVALGKTAQLTAELRDQAGNVLTGQSVVWSSANPSVAGVNGSGLVTALAAGTTTITAASGALSAQATITVSGTGVGTVAVSPAAVQLQVGASQELDATVLDVNGGAMPNAAISWSSANPSVATVSAAGRVSAVSAGLATITATASGKSGSATVTVSAPAALAVASVSVTFNSPSVQVGQATQAVAVARDANGQVVTGRPVLWLSDDPVLASVSATGLVTALAGGSATIAARVDGVTGLATLAIGAPAPLPVYSVQLAVSPNAIATGQTAASTATLRDSLGNSLSGRTIGWSSSRSTVASVGLGGTVTGVSAGSATITATSEGKSGSAGVSVSGSTPTVASVSVAVTASSLTPGQSTQATATVRDSSGASLAGYTVTWTSSNTAAATVSPSGLVTAVAAGASTITATAGGKSGSAAVNVTNPVVASVTVALSSGSLTVGQTTQGTATAKDATGATIAGAVVVWSSSNTAVAAVSAAGLVSAVAAGTANISATSGGKTGAAPVSVTAPATGGTVPSIAAALPQASVSTAWVAPTGRTLPVNAGGNLQAALDSARRGDEIVVQAGATFTGNFVLRAKSGTGVVLVRTSAIASLPPLGSRVAASDTVYMPRLVSANNGQTIATTAGASGWRLVGLHVTIAPNAAGVNNPNYGLIALGEISPAQTLANMPRDLVLDRMVIRAQPSTYTARCVALNSAYSAIINSQLLECHGKGFDSQAIVGLNGSGPFLIENNRLEAAGEVIMFGGGDPDIVNLIPGDITIRRNYLTRPMSWQGVWTVKNLFELKNAQRVLFEANALDNHWVDAQAGSAVVLGTVEQDGYCDWCVVQDVTFQYNHLHNVAAGFNVFAQCGHPSPGAPYGCSNGAGQPTRRVTLRHNLLTNVGVAGLGAGGSTARVFLLQEDVHDLLIEHNTGFAPYSYATFHGTGSGAKQRFTFHRNIGGASQYDWFSTYGSGDAANTASFTSPYLVERNGFVTTTASLVPTGSLTVSSVAAVGFVNPVWPNGNWSLGAGSPFAGLGADYAVLSSNLAGVR